MKNKKLYRWILLVPVLLQFNGLFAQTREMQIGEQLPDLYFKNACNFKTNKAAPFRISDLKGKLVILDFWGTYCIPCIAAFPKMDSLQMHYQDRIQIITVTNHSQDSIRSFFKHHQMVYRPSLIFITGDTLLNKLFPHTGVPFQVWIGKRGQILHKAESYNLTEQNIDSTLADKEVNIRVTSKNVYPATIFDNRWANQVMFSSYLVHGVDNGLHIDGPVIGKGFTDGGTELYLYQRAYDELTFHKFELFRPGRTLLEVRDPSAYVSSLKGEAGAEWDDKHTYWYQISVPADYKGNIFELMKSDLKRYFNLDAVIQKREVKCLVLVRSSLKDKLQTRGGTAMNTFHKADARSPQFGETRYLRNMPFVVLKKSLEAIVENGFHRPFQDSTAFSENIDFKMKGEVLDHINLSFLKRELNKYDLDLVERKCLLNVLVLKEQEESKN